MTNQERIDILREGWELALAANSKADSITKLYELGEHALYFKFQEYLALSKTAADYAERYFTPEVINAETEEDQENP